MSAITIAFATRKGGVGKTTTALGFAAVAASHNRKTLLVDLDQEGHATFGAGAEVISTDPANPSHVLNHPGTADLLLERGVPVQTINPYLDVLAGNNDLEDPDIARLDPDALAIALQPLPYDVIVIDCPPNHHQLSRFGLIAANSVCIPVDAHPYALNCASRLIQDMEHRRAKQRRGPDRWAIVANRIDTRRRLDAEMLADAEALFAGIPLFRISQDTMLSNSSCERKLITDYANQKSKVIAELTAIVKWSGAIN